MEPIKWIDEFYDDGNRTVLSNRELQIDGLATFGRHFLTKAISALHQHYHQDCMEITYIAKGNAYFQIDGTEYKLSGGDIFVTFPDEVHSTGKMPLPLNEMYWMQLDLSNASSLLFLNEQGSRYLVSELLQISNRVIKTDNREMHLLIKQVFSRLYRFEGAHRYEAAGYLVVFLHRLLEYDKQVRFTLTADIFKATDYILDAIREDIKLDELAALCNLSLSGFKQKFKQQMGVTPREFINYHKVEQAKAMLIENNNITDVALDLGFSSSNYFSVVFKRFTTYTPTEYIQMHCKRHDPT